MSDFYLELSGHKAVILDDILHERTRQDEQWGGSGHDDQHDPRDWLDYMSHQAHQMFDFDGEPGNPPLMRPIPDIRERFIKIAALAVAAVESMDRKTPK